MADRNTPVKVVWRARIVLATADSGTVKAICRATGKSKPCVWRWQKRFADEGVAGLLRDKTRPPGRKPLPPDLKAKVLAKTARETPPDATHWSVRTMAKAMGISHTSVQRIWAEAGLKPHLTAKFKVSNDPQFEEKVTEIVGLYMSPPDKALVLCVDEKSQIQALDRTQPGLPLKKGRAATMTHDYKMTTPRRQTPPTPQQQRTDAYDTPVPHNNSDIIVKPTVASAKIVCLPARNRSYINAFVATGALAIVDDTCAIGVREPPLERQAAILYRGS